MTFDELEQLVNDGDVTTIVVGFTDHYGRTLGKRFDARFFCESLDAGTHVCDYLFTVDMEMEPIPGFASANWDSGYGDVHLVPDLTTLRIAGWSEATAIVLCDVLHDTTQAPVAIAPRSILRQQIDAATAAGFATAAASELEFFLFRDSYRTANTKNYTDLTAAGWYVEDYHLLQAARVDDYVGAARRALVRSDIPVENSKGEAAVGQHELNIRYADILTMADRHVVMKQGMKELADSLGVSVTFMAKPDGDQPGNSCHIHLSLWQEGQNAFAANNPSGRSDVFRWFLGGWMAHTTDLMPFYAPTVNSYKRYQSASWAPTTIGWSTDNRTAGFRIVGSGQSLRIECRLPGADVNPYLANAAALASGLDGVANRIEPPAESRGNHYNADLPTVPQTLADATARLSQSEAARRFFGDDVVEHYVHFFRSEMAAFNAAVTDWEMRRYFERI